MESLFKKLSNLFALYKENGRIIVKFFGIKITFKSPFFNQLSDCCCIVNLKRLLDNNTTFIHPVGIVISQSAEIGKNCAIYQNVTIGDGKLNPQTNRKAPVIKDNVTIYANAVVIGGITIGNNVVIGAGSVVLNDVEDNCTVVGNPARVVKKAKENV